MTTTAREMIQAIRLKIAELEQTIRVIQSLDSGPKSLWEHVNAALDQLERPANVKTLAATMQENGWETTSKNVTGLLTQALRLKHKSGQLAKMGRGLYGKPEWGVPASRKVRAAVRGAKKIEP